MDMRYPVHQSAIETMNTDALRAQFHVGKLFIPGELNMVYSHIDRVIIGGAVPADAPLALEASKSELAAEYFLERREIGVINIGGPGSIKVDGDSFTLDRKDGLYIGRGKRDVTFHSESTVNPAHFYFFSAPSHTEHPTTAMKIADAEPVHLGDTANSNVRTIYKYIHPDGVQSSQIMMGITMLEPGSMWNTMPAHLHARRMEVYLYFDLDADNVIFHLMGDPAETRHLVMRNEEAIISPSWSIHAGMGTSNYAFVWAMAGENQAFSDMDAVAMHELR